ncbi:MAG: hypothetical protein R2749_29580 [Acidimicrobiales bacterium]
MATIDWADQTVLARAAATIRWASVDQDGGPADPGGAVTVDITNSAGTAVATGLSTTGGTPTFEYTAALTAAQVGAQPEQLTATWKTGSTVLATTVIDIAGGVYFTVAEARAHDPNLVDAAKYPAARISATRRVVERECELICGVAFVPRWRVVTVDGAGDRDLSIPVAMVRTVRSAVVDGTALSAGELADLTVDGAARAVWQPDGHVWPHGRRNVVLGVEHGHTSPPPDLVEATLWRLYDLLQTPLRVRDLDRAMRMTVATGQTYDLAKPSALTTGLPAVDAVYARYSQVRSSTGGGSAGAPTGGGLAAASRPLDLDPQYGSLFHGGRR